MLRRKVRENYRAKDAEFPVQVGLAAYLPEKARPDRRPDREALFRFAVTRFAGSSGLSEEVIRTEPRSKIKELLASASSSLLPAADLPDIEAKVHDALRGTKLSEAGDAQEVADWCRTELKLDIPAASLTGTTPARVLDAVLNAYDTRYRPEMHQTERSLVLEQLDSSWKAHLLTMDHLRSVVGLASYGQEDPKIVYKREGMREFDAMWVGVRDNVSKSVLRMEDVGEEQVEAAMWAGQMSRQAQAESALKARAAQMASEWPTETE